jgi:hypothetical protein
MGAEQHRVCQVCGADRLSDLRRGILAGPAVAELVRKATGSWSDKAWVLESLRQQEILSRNPEEELQAGWKFLILFVVVMALWIGVNSVVLIIRPFDPYPFIFLNLVLSCLAAIQAPVIDHLLSHQWERLVEIQEIQMESINETRDRK